MSSLESEGLGLSSGGSAPSQQLDACDVQTGARRKVDAVVEMHRHGVAARAAGQVGSDRKRAKEDISCLGDSVSTQEPLEMIVEVKNDSHVQIIADRKGERPATKLAKVRVEGDYLIMEQEDSEAGDVAGQDSSSVDLSLARGLAKRAQKYRQQWESHPALSGWLCMMPDNPYRAWCRQCGCTLISQLKVLLDHARCRKHQRRADGPQVAPPSPSSAVHQPLPSFSSGITPGSQWARRSRDRDQQRQQQLDISYGDSNRVTYSIGLGEQRVGFIGAGKIAQAIAAGMMSKGVTAAGRIMVSAPSERNMAIWRRWKCRTTHNNCAVLHQCDIVFLCVAPVELDAVLVGLEPPADGAERCLISTVAGIGLDRLTHMVNEQFNSDLFMVIRCVPSKTVSIGEGFCVYSAAADLPHTWLLAMETMFSAMGLCQRVEDHLMDVYGAAFSSGVAYAAAFIDALASGAANHGVRWTDAVQMAAQVTQGAANMVLCQGVSPAELRRDSAAPGGNTLAGLMALHKHGLEYAVMSAVDEATKKARELGER